MVVTKFFLLKGVLPFWFLTFLLFSYTVLTFICSTSPCSLDFWLPILHKEGEGSTLLVVLKYSHSNIDSGNLAISIAEVFDHVMLGWWCRWQVSLSSSLPTCTISRFKHLLQQDFVMGSTAPSKVWLSSTRAFLSLFWIFLRHYLNASWLCIWLSMFEFLVFFLKEWIWLLIYVYFSNPFICTHSLISPPDFPGNYKLQWMGNGN